MIPSATPEKTNSVHKAVYGVVLFGSIAAIGVIGIVLYGSYGERSMGEIDNTVDTLMQNARTGQYEAVVDDYNSLISDSALSPDGRAFATFNMIGARYQVSGKIEDLQLDIRDMKAVIQDSAVAPKLRAEMITELAMLYHSSGKHPTVFSEIFEQNDAFTEYLIPDNPEGSVANIVEWSYGIAPSAYSAIYLANWHSWHGFRDAEQSALAAGYLQEGERLAEQELETRPMFQQGVHYPIYLFMRASALHRLALQQEEVYSISSAHDEFIDFFRFMEALDSVPIRERLLTYARLFFATYIADNEAEREEHLNNLAQELRQIQNPDTNSTILFLRDEYAKDSIWWNDIVNVMGISTAFDNVMNELVLR